MHNFVCYLFFFFSVAYAVMMMMMMYVNNDVTDDVNGDVVDDVDDVDDDDTNDDDDDDNGDATLLCRRQAGCILYTLLAGFPPFHATEAANFDIRQGSYYSMAGPVWDIPSDEAKDLVRRMLTLDPQERIDMEGILSHPWLSDSSTNVQSQPEAIVDMGRDYRARIKSLVFVNKLKRYFLSNNIEAGFLSKKEAAEFYFLEFDRDRDGLIDLEGMVSECMCDV
jgi:serine/threonine protein kinase